MSKNLSLFLLWITLLPIPYLNLSVNLVYGNTLNNSSGNESRIKGRVVDAETKAPIEFAYILLFQKDDSIHLSQTMTEKNGYFTIDNIPTGKYFITVSYVGYYKEKTNILEISGQNKTFNIKEITLKVDVKNIEEVIIQAKKGKPSILIDKTVINVDDLPQGEGGTAIDVLRKLPSITQTPDGEISVHGSTNFLVLINGKPTSLKGNEMLHFIPAAEILKVELIGSPTAKYDASGSGGIINIITKNTFNNGISGIVTVAGDQLGGYSSDMLFNYKKEKINFFAGIDHNKRKAKGDIERWTNNYSENDTSHFYEEGTQSAIRNNTGFRSGIDISLAKYNKISFGANIGNYEISNSGDWNTLLTYENNENTEQEIVTNRNKRNGNYGGSDLSFKHIFNEDDKNLTVSALWTFNNYDDSYQNNIDQTNGEEIMGQNTTIDKNYDEYQINMDYVAPLGKTGKFEAGYQLNLESQFEDYHSDQTNNGSITSNQNSTDFNRDQHAFYTVFGDDGKKIEWKIGLRAEYFNRNLENSSGEYFKKENLDFYPSLNSLWSIDSTQQIGLSFSRRTNKISANQIDPLPRWYDYYQVRVGNPLLDNEMSNKISITYSKELKNFTFDTELYYLGITDKIEIIRTVYEDQIIQNRYENIGTEKTLGMEIDTEYSLTKWWSLIEKVDLYYNRIEIDQPSTSPIKKYNQLVSLTTSKFTISPTTFLELDLSYYGPSMNSQVELGSFLMSGMTFRKQFFDKKLSFTVTGTDIFGLYKADEMIKGEDFDQHIITQAILPIRFSLSYKLNNFKKDEKRTPKTPPAE